MALIGGYEIFGKLIENLSYDERLLILSIPHAVSYLALGQMPFDSTNISLTLSIVSATVLLGLDCWFDRFGNVNYPLALYSSALIDSLTFTNTQALPWDVLKAVVIGFGEEAFFRGTIQPILRDCFNCTTTSTIITSALFAWIHRGNVYNFFQNDRNSKDLRRLWLLALMPFYFVTGAYFSFLAESTQSILTGSIAHVFWNFLAYRIHRQLVKLPEAAQ